MVSAVWGGSCGTGWDGSYWFSWFLMHNFLSQVASSYIAPEFHDCSGEVLQRFKVSLVVPIESLSSLQFYELFLIWLYGWPCVCLLLCVNLVCIGSWPVLSMIFFSLVPVFQTSLSFHLSSKMWDWSWFCNISIKWVGLTEHILELPPSIAPSFDHEEHIVLLLTTNLYENDTHSSCYCYISLLSISFYYFQC